MGDSRLKERDIAYSVGISSEHRCNISHNVTLKSCHENGCRECTEVNENVIE